MKRTLTGAVVALLTATALVGCGGDYTCRVTVDGNATPSAAAAVCEPNGQPTTNPPTQDPTDPPTVDPTVEPTEDPTTPPPTEEPTDPPVEEFHGEDVTYGNVGPGDTTGFTVRAGGNVTGAPQVWDHTIVNGNLTLRTDLVCNYCVINGSPGTTSSGYAVRMTDAAGSPSGTDFTCNHCAIYSNNPYAKTVGATGAMGVHLYRTLVTGGVDSVFVNLVRNDDAARTINGVAYQLSIVESFITDPERVASSHTDAVQMDNSGSHTSGRTLLARSRIQSCNPPREAGTCPVIGNAAFINTYGSTAGQLDGIHVIDNCAIGGNYELFMSSGSIGGPAPTDVIVRGNRTGGLFQYGSIVTPAGADVANNDIGGCSPL